VYAICLSVAEGATAEQWRTRVIYQLMTDRFALTEDNFNFPCDLYADTYCGGTWKGIIKHLDYIQDLGADAIWISPTLDNFPNGYHGYWANTLYGHNPHFGTNEDLLELIEECHKRDIWVMGDVVANHMGYGDIALYGWENVSVIVPFNESWMYHDCTWCNPVSCWVDDYTNLTQMEYCRLFGLPDLNQSVPWVNETLLNWIDDLIQTYHFDGVRIDTLPYVQKDFWFNFSHRAGVYTIGEVADGRIDYVASFQGCVDGLLNFPMYYTLMNVFTQNFPMTEISKTWRRSTGDDILQNCPAPPPDGDNSTDNNTQPDADYFGPSTYPSGGYGDNNTDTSGTDFFSDIGLIGNFIENHDQPRFLYFNPNPKAYRNSLLWVLAAEGIPVLYYGGEQGYNGGPNPGSREALWSSKYAKESSWLGMYSYIQRILKFRKASEFYFHPYQELYAQSNLYVFARGPVIFVITNDATGNITASFGHLPWRTGTEVCNILTLDGPTDCITVNDTRILTVQILDGEPKIYSSVALTWPTSTVPLRLNFFFGMLAIAGGFLICMFVFGMRMYWKKATLRRGKLTSTRKFSKNSYQRIY